MTSATTLGHATSVAQRRRSPRARRSRSRRVLGVLGSVIALGATAIVGVAGALLVHLDTPVARRVVASQGTAILGKVFAGRVVVEGLAHLGLDGVAGLRVRVFDPEGVQVLLVDGVAVRLHALDIARSALASKGPLRVAVDDASIGLVDANLDADASGALRLARAFAPKTPSPEAGSGDAGGEGRGVLVEAPRVALGHAWAHGAPAGAPYVDAELRELRAGVHVDPRTTQATLDRVELVARALPRPGATRGLVSGAITLPGPSERAFTVDARYDGLALGLPVTLQARTDGVRVDARLDARAQDGRTLAALLDGAIQPSEETSAHLEVHGTLPDLDASARVAIGARGRLDLTGHAHLGEVTKRASARLVARGIDLHALLPTAPSSALGLDAEGEVTLDEGRTRGRLWVETTQGRLAKDAVPRVVARAELDGERATANVRVLGDVAPIEADLTLAPVSGDRVVEADVRAAVPELARLPGPLAVATGRASLRVSGRYALGSEALSARVEVTGTKLARAGAGDQAVDDVRALATVTGALREPVVALGVRAEGLRSGSLSVPSVDARLLVRAAPGHVTASDVHVDLAREDVHVGVTAEQVDLAGDALRVTGGVVDGLGDPIRATLTRRGPQVDVAVDATAVDLARVASLVGRGRDVRAGKLAFATRLRARTDGVPQVEGDLRATIEHASGGGLEEAGLALEASVHDRAASLGLGLALGRAGSLTARADRILADGDPTKASSWARATGALDLDGDVALHELRTLLPGVAERFSELEGRVTLRASAARRSPEARPDVRVHVKTRGLVLAGPVHEEPPIDGTVVTSVAPYRAEGVDVELDASALAESDDAEVAVRAIDATSVLAVFDAKASLPFARLLAGQLSRAELARAPLSAHLVVPDRRLAAFPESLGLANLGGHAGLELVLAGSVAEPRVAFLAKGEGLRSAALGARAPADAAVRFVYDGRSADLEVLLASDGGRVRALTHVDAPASALGLAGPPPPGPARFRAASRVELADFPLDVFGPLANSGVRGRASGEVRLDGLNEDAKLAGHLELGDLRVRGARYGKGVIDLAAGDGIAKVGVRLDQPDGHAELVATTGLSWGAELAPSLDPARPAEAHLVAKAFRLQALQPLLAGPVNGLDGRLDGDATVALDGPSVRLQGGLALSGGKAQITALGQELRDIRAKVVFDPSGTVRVEDVLARGLAGEVRADAVVRLDGARLAGATANVEIPEKEKMDLALEGQPLGQVWGKAHIEAGPKAGSKDLEVKVDVPKVAVLLAASTKSGVQELGPPVKVRVGTYRTPGRFVKLPLDREDVETAKAQAKGRGKDEATSPHVDKAAALEVAVNLHEAVVERGNMARVVVEGEPRIALGEETQMSGQIRVREGKVDVRGKRFDVQRGVITFTGEPSNPTVVATAGWEAQDGTRVYADFVGPVKTGKVELRSEPARSKSEILALVLFGTADGVNPTQPARGSSNEGTAKTAVGIGGGLAAEGLTEALDDLAGIQAQARVDTTSSNNPRPELEVQLTPRISLEVSHVLGTPPIAEPDKNYVSLDWRFRRNWSLETTFGDRGRALFDAVWQKRY